MASHINIVRLPSVASTLWISYSGDGTKGDRSLDCRNSSLLQFICATSENETCLMKWQTTHKYPRTICITYMRFSLHLQALPHLVIKRRLTESRASPSAETHTNSLIVSGPGRHSDPWGLWGRSCSQRRTAVGRRPDTGGTHTLLQDWVCFTDPGSFRPKLTSVPESFKIWQWGIYKIQDKIRQNFIQVPEIAQKWNKNKNNTVINVKCIRSKCKN